MKEFPTDLILQLACAAQVRNNGYLKDGEMYCADNEFSNKNYIYDYITTEQDQNRFYRSPDKRLTITDADIEAAETIKKFFKRLAFTALSEQNDYKNTIFKILNRETVTYSEIGYIASIPNFFNREYDTAQIQKKLSKCIDEKLGEIGDRIEDKKCDVVIVSYLKNYSSWAVTGIIDNKIVSWFSKHDITLGEVELSAKIKSNTNSNYHVGKIETRLNYIRITKGTEDEQ